MLPYSRVTRVATLLTTRYGSHGGVKKKKKKKKKRAAGLLALAPSKWHCTRPKAIGEIP
jgi:hypothetical protein